jgi:exoribonuclease-2
VSAESSHTYATLRAAAGQLMRLHGFSPDFDSGVNRQLADIAARSMASPSPDVRDLRGLFWSSIDNDTSRDLDQVEVAEGSEDGTTLVRVAIADVDALVPRHSSIDNHASQAGTTVYTAVGNFPMLPEPLSTDATSLLESKDRIAVVIEFLVDVTGNVQSGKAYRALVRNAAQLTYETVGLWLEREGAAPSKVSGSHDLQAQLTMQNACAQRLRQARYRHGALNIETIETHAVVLKDQSIDIGQERKNLATELIEDFMIAANEVVARLFETGRVASIRRVVRTPERWARIVELARTAGGSLPDQPDSKALNDFLVAQKARDPDRFADLSLAVIKLMGPGEYVLERPGEPAQPHFGLAVQDYTHSTAPNRRFADLVTQRVLKALLGSQPPPYTDAELAEIARNCTLKEDAARKVEREVAKRVAAVAMSGRVGESFDAIVTGVTPRGTFVRVLHPHVEGLLVRGQHNVDVGDKLRVVLVSTDPDRGYIDFARDSR